MAERVKPTTKQRRTTSTSKLPRIKPMREMGASGTAIHGGFITTIEKSSDWRGQQRWRTASEIAANVSIVAASMHHFLNLIAHPTWSVKPPRGFEDDPQALELAEWVEDLMDDTFTSWSRIIRRSANYRFYGFSINEWIAKRRSDGRIGLRDVEQRPQHSIEKWEISDEGKIEGVWQRSRQTFRLLGIPRGKFLYLVEDTMTDSPEGVGMLRHLAEPYNRFKKLLQIEVQAYERDLRGIPIGRAPLALIKEAVKSGALTQQEADALTKGLEDFVKLQVTKSDTGIMLDSQPHEAVTNTGTTISAVMQWGLDLLQGTGRGLSELNNAIDRLQREMARIIGTEHLMMGDVGGNRALAEDKSRNLYLNANAVLDYVVEQANTDILTPIWALNGLPDNLKPKLIAEEVAFRDVQNVTASLRDMATAGAVLAPEDPVINDVRDMLGVSRAPEMDPELTGDLTIPEPTDPLDDPGDEDDDDFDLDDMEDEKSRYGGNKPRRRRRKPIKRIRPRRR